jgi:ZIP family zinc transporter
VTVHGYGPLFALLSVASTAAGGFLALRLRSRLGAVMAFTGGVVLGVALFDLAPEAIEQLGSAGTPRDVGLAMGIGYLGFLVLSRLAVLHHRDAPDDAAAHRPVGGLGAAALSFHSLLDGFGIGAGFAISAEVGVFVLVAVVAHDFADGMNTVTFVLSQHQRPSRARAWLAVDAIAPEIGALIGAAVPLSGQAYALGLAAFAGVFLMIGAGELLTQAHEESSLPRLALTVVGAAFIFVVTGLVG